MGEGEGVVGVGEEQSEYDEDVTSPSASMSGLCKACRDQIMPPKVGIVCSTVVYQSNILLLLNLLIISHVNNLDLRSISSDFLQLKNQRNRKKFMGILMHD
jgi:hypothetical protein